MQPVLATFSRTLCSEAGSSLVLSHYPPGGSQGRHAHDHAQLSFLLCGEIEEQIGGRSFEALGPSTCFKPAGAPHSDNWGRHGALMLSLRMSEPSSEPAPRPAHWRSANMRSVGMVLRAALNPSVRPQFDLLSSDLLGCANDKELRFGSPPSWLKRVREAAAEAPDFSIAEAAREAGVHRVHLSRAFARAYGLPLSVYRQRTRLARAVTNTLRSPDGLADVALEAGYADQAHMTRSLRAATGTTPRGLRRLLSPAA
jgi:AraC-like DNA-binding protein